MVMQERRLRNNWEKFWAKRKDRPINHTVFHNNFMFMRERMYTKFRSLRGLKTLEVGSGRGIMSDFLHDYGCDTYCVDKHYVLPDNGQKHKFFQADAFDLPFPDHYFDLVFSYGLIEHFNTAEQINFLISSRIKIKRDGLAIHYVVPKKLANIFEDRSVYRDPCYFLNTQNIIWVYPAIRSLPCQAWETNKFLGKGFWYEDTSVGNR